MKLLATWLLIPLSLAHAETRVGVVGADASVLAFARYLNDNSDPDHVPGARVVAAYRGSRPDKTGEELRNKWKVDITPDIGSLCRKVDAVVIGTENPAERLQQIKAVIAAGKPLFLESPMAATLDDARAIVKLLRSSGLAWFSASDVRFGQILDIKGPSVINATTWGPGPIEKGAHAIEMLYGLMGTGCEELIYSESASDGPLTGPALTGRWPGDRVGSVRSSAADKGWGALVGSRSRPRVTQDYRSLLVEIVKFFETSQPPVSNEETLEIFEFLDAAQRSKAAGGAPMKLR